jgi:transposase
MASGFWLSDRQWAEIEPLLPTNQPGCTARGRPPRDLWHRARAQGKRAPTTTALSP